jgi:3-deoxy-D-manno-octulosonate 8-phosphate phosphatase (KDO 8-P phosphatase)
VSAEQAPSGDALRNVALVVFDFDGVFTDNTVWVSEDGVESVRCWRGDGIGLARLRSCGVATTVLSTEVNPVVTTRCRKLAIDVEQGCEDKLSSLRSLLDRLGVAAEATCFVGNDINDAGCLEHVGLPVVVADAHRDVLHLAHYRTTAPGGRGAVREICDLIADARATGGPT